MMPPDPPAWRDDIVYDDADQPRRWKRRAPDDVDDGDAEGARALLGQRVLREIEERRAVGEPLRPVLPGHHRNLATTFWGKAWNRHLADCALHADRLPRGRTIFRGGRVMDLAVAKGSLIAVVAGSRLHDVRVLLAPLDETAAASLTNRLRGRIGSVVDLLSGKLGDEVMRVVTDPAAGLLPEAAALRSTCSCPDHADLCEHGAAVLYAAGSHFDDRPADLFLLRGIDPLSLVSGSLTDVVEGLVQPPAAAASPLGNADLSDLFGIPLEPGDPS